MSDRRPSPLGVHPARQAPPSPSPALSPRQWQPLLVKVPEITVYFWVIKLLTTALGESTSDFLVYQINPYVAVGLGCLGLVATVILQLWLRRYVAWVYWLAALMVAVFGTMAADVLHVVLGVSYVVSTVLFSAALAVIFVAWYVSEHTLSIHSVYRGRRELFYWAAVIATFALGTAAGDLTAATLNLGYFPSILLFAVLFALPALGYWLLRFNAIAAFWWAYIVTRPLGASIADWLGKPYLGGLGFGDDKVSLVLLILLVLFVAYVSVTRRDVQDRPAETR
ncbi:COG4705 family protein [Thermogemmatispora onikobensis]|uniref:COG4705 family protein n=1 Tax=Thermogemmatispora onikobensis TaxID=732234 RepID=UPI001C402CB9|nr:hypothetical protein [Thermogemmatispora onikobensis]